MTEIERECPTCRSRQRFRLLTNAEKAAVRKKKGPRFFVGNLWRCTAKGCLWYQPYLNRGGGERLPEEFGEAAKGR
ncbi:hypothetical protein [Streptomyces sp. NBC_00078]|uniref:hypothetical protein n=1 Tax=unclassified Streptomyces TaxID=2593676 RepID=UPI002255E6FE|nr:hypothetical protein [Streptomyces sp. NBC_00078]MCX5420829.1 hypothetical protein [Streptomyces sp. NBC_00078]